MLKKTVTYTDYNGVERTESFYFNLTKAEIVEMELGVDGGWTARMQKIIDSKDGPTIMREFKKLIMMSYGEKSEDGKRFVKSKELSENFIQTEAYNKIFMDIVTDSKAAAEFANGILPEDSKSRQDMLPSSK